MPWGWWAYCGFDDPALRPPANRAERRAAQRAKRKRGH